MIGLIPVVTEHPLRPVRLDLAGRRFVVVSDGDGRVTARVRVDGLTATAAAAPDGGEHDGEG